jgi:hypothetical protein
MTFQLHRDAMVRIPRNAAVGRGKVSTLMVEKTVLAEAIRAANGDPGRLEILGTNEIIVWNSREQRYAVHAAKRHNRPSQRTPMAGKRSR